MTMERVPVPLAPTSLLFPFELINQVGEPLIGNSKALQNCSLVCRAWHSAIQPLIFHRVTLTALSNLNELGDLFDSIPSLPFWIQEILILGEPLLSQHQRATKGSTVDPMPVPADSGDWYKELPNILEGKLQRVHTFTFLRLGESIQLHNLLEFHPLLKSFPTLTSINIQDCQIIRGGDYLKHFIHAILVPQLKHLHFHDNNIILPTRPYTYHQSDPIEPLQHKAQLSSLRIHSSSFNGMADQYAHLILKELEVYSDSFDSMSTFHFHVCSPFHLRENGQWFRKLGAQVQNLSLEFRRPSVAPSRRETEDIKRNYNLSLMTSLRRLHLHEVNHPAIPYLLLSIRSPFLETIVFNISTIFIHDLKPETYVEVDGLLHRPIFGSLQTVLFIYSGQSTLERVVQRLKLVFPLLTKRDNIRVVIDKRPKTACPDWGDVVRFYGMQS